MIMSLVLSGCRFDLAVSPEPQRAQSRVGLAPTPARSSSPLARSEAIVAISATRCARVTRVVENGS